MKNNIRFLIKILVVFVLVLSILIGTSAIYKNGLTYKGTYSGIEKYENVPSDIEFANFGPSYGMNCFKYDTVEAMGKTGFNFSLTMQDLYHDYAIYKTFKDNFKEGAVVAIPLSYFSFCSDTSAPTGNRYYKLLDREYIKGYTLEKEVSAKYIPVYGKGVSLIRDMTNDLFISIMKKSEEALETETDETSEMSAEDEELKKDSSVRIMTIENGNLKVYADHIAINEEILVNWIEEMKEAGLIPVLMLTPYWHDYAYGFDEELLDISYNDPVARVVGKTGVDYINFCGEEYYEYIHTAKNFSNCDHVSKEGGKAFMKLYIDYLAQKGLLK